MDQPWQMDFCPGVDNLTVPNTSVRWGELFRGAINDHKGASYLRPDIGGALLPWVYTVIVILVHIPTVIIRVQRWETVQTWCLAATLLTVVLYVQAYVSTGFAPEQVLTWTPLLLVIDAGSMLQLFVLVVEAGELVPRVQNEIAAGLRRLRDRYRRLRAALGPRRRRAGRRGMLDGMQINPGEDQKVMQSTAQDITSPDVTRGPSPTAPNGTQADVEAARPEQEISVHGPLKKDRAFWVAISSFVLIIAVFVLQILGLNAAAQEARQPAPTVSWCSPIFQPFGVAVLDGNCNVYAVEQSFSKGIGCIRIPAVQQMAWIKGTLIVTSLTLIFQFFDLLILVLVNSDSRWAEVKMRRPWCTIFGGMAVLGVTLLYGIRYSYELPPGVTERVIVVMEVQERLSLYAGRLSTAGLRGAIIGWNDGVFSGWATTYFGSWAWQTG